MPIDEFVGFHRGDGAGDATPTPNILISAVNRAPGTSICGGTDVFPDGAGTVEFVVSTRVRNDREQVSCRGTDLDRATDLVAAGVHNADDHRGAQLF